MPAKTSGRKKASELEQVRARVAKALGLSEEEAELRALRELEASLPQAAATKPAPHPAPSVGPLPQRLYLLLDGRGLDGRGMPVEVIDLPCVVGSGKNCSVWINFLGDGKIRRRVLQHGDELRLAGYLRLRAELR